MRDIVDGVGRVAQGMQHLRTALQVFQLELTTPVLMKNKPLALAN
ncbi:hypothetical protein [uncultured Rhodoferax sp.]|nr:hypothetical protein [uncultured Rhodoferax sp.]